MSYAKVIVECFNKKELNKILNFLCSHDIQHETDFLDEVKE